MARCAPDNPPSDRRFNVWTMPEITRPTSTLGILRISPGRSGSIGAYCSFENQTKSEVAPKMTGQDLTLM